MNTCGCDDRRWRLMLDRRRALLGGAGVALGLAAARGGAVAQEATPLAGGQVLVAQPPIGPLPNGSFISPYVELHGDVVFGRGCFVASNTLLLAAPGRRIALGDETNCQDNAYVLASTADLSGGAMVSIAHQASIEDSVVGDFTFFGFRARVRNSTVGAGTMVLHNTVVDGVTLPPNRITPSGATITSQEVADALPELVPAHEAFKTEVQRVNQAFASGYTALYEDGGVAAVEGVGPNPVTPFTPESIDPQLGQDVQLREMVRIVGDVRLGDRARVGQRTAIRADEGAPIIIGRNARIGNRVTFHALEHTSLVVGDTATIGEECVLHGPLTAGHNLTCEDGAVLFRATVEDNVTLREGATVVGEIVLREGTIVPERTVVETQEQADALPRR
jgi:carbonic anhydrase/acetyltransferase-like protein (isoleucine patch superfamily)